MDVTAINTAFQSLKTAKELLGVVFNAKVDAEAKPKILEAQARLGVAYETLTTLQEQLFQLQGERDKLKSELAATEAWQSKLDKYELSQTTGGGVVYRYKAEPAHFACPNCINKQQIQILQGNGSLSGKYRCTGCNSDFPIQPRQTITPLPTEHHWP